MDARSFPTTSRIDAAGTPRRGAEHRRFSCDHRQRLGQDGLHGPNEPETAANSAQLTLVSVPADISFLQDFRRVRATSDRRLKIVVSPVRVRVSPSENRLLVGVFFCSRDCPSGRDAGEFRCECLIECLNPGLGAAVVSRSRSAR